MTCTTHVAVRGRELFAEVCAQDLEGIVAKRADSS
jgi:ATP-dependent DNA ligase